MITALQLQYWAMQATDKSVIDDSTSWLMQGGYTEEVKKKLGVEGWKNFVTIFPNSGIYTEKTTQSLKNKNHFGNRIS